MSSKGCRVFVGNLPRGVETREVETMFRKYGRILYVDLKNRGRTDQGPPFAFVEFEDSRDAEDAVAERDGMTYENCKIRVEFPRGVARGRGGGRSGSPDRRFPGDGIGRSGGSVLRRSSYRVSVSGLPVNLSWQDLKDHMRDAGEVCFAEVFRDGSGMVEFRSRDGVLNAVEKMNDTRIRSREGDTAQIRVKEDNSGGGGSSRARSRSRSRSRGRSYSPPARRGRGRSPSSTPPRKGRGRSRSDSRSRSRSRSSERK